MNEIFQPLLIFGKRSHIFATTAFKKLDQFSN